MGSPYCSGARAGQCGLWLQIGAGTVLNVLRPTACSLLIMYGADRGGLHAVMAAVSEGRSAFVDPVASRRAAARDLGAVAPSVKGITIS